MKQTTQRLSGILFALLLLVAAAIAFFELVQPEYAALLALKGQEASETQFLAGQQKIATQVQSVIAQFQSQTSGTQAVNLAMPIGADSAGALAQLYGLATASGLAVQSVGISLQAAPQANDGSTASLIKPSGSLTFQISSSGSYEALQTFLAGIETNVRVFDVTAISIRPVASVTTSGATLTGTQDLYNYNITVVAYYQSS